MESAAARRRSDGRNCRFDFASRVEPFGLDQVQSRLLTNAYLDGLSAAVLQPVLRADVWETFDALDRARSHYSGVDTRYVLVEMPNGKVLASSDPARFPVESDLPLELKLRFSANEALVIDSSAGRAWPG